MSQGKSEGVNGAVRLRVFSFFFFSLRNVACFVWVQGDISTQLSGAAGEQILWAFSS